jgi:hypothetical protein
MAAQGFLRQIRPLREGLKKGAPTPLNAGL